MFSNPLKFKLLQTDVIGFGIGYDFKEVQIIIHLFIWSLDISFI